jgi:hypothetical protein
MRQEWAFSPFKSKMLEGEATFQLNLAFVSRS